MCQKAEGCHSNPERAVFSGEAAFKSPKFCGRGSLDGAGSDGVGQEKLALSVDKSHA